MQRKNNSPPTLTRSAEIRSVKGDRRVDVSFSSETPYLRWFGYEVLGHRNGEVDLERFEKGAAVLFNHKTDDLVGVIEKVWIDGDVGRATIRFGKSARASEVYQDVEDGILKHVSVGYFVDEMELENDGSDGPDTYRVKWTPFEISLVPVPADITVGVGREDDQNKFMRYFGMENQQTRSQKIAEKNGGHNAAVKAERDRVEELRTVGELYGAEDLASQFIRSGATVEDLNKAILDRSGLEPTHTDSRDIGLTPNEIGQFNISKAILAKLDPTEFAKDAGFELEVSRALEQNSKTALRGNIHIPHEVLAASRDLNVGTAIDGGNLVATNLMAGSFIDLLRNASATLQAGATHLPGLVGNVAIPRQTGAETTAWVAENGVLTESSATFDQVTLSPKTVGAYSELSRRLLKQGTPFAEALVMRSLSDSVAQAIDLAAIAGDGTGNAPTGILNTVGIGDVPLGTNGAAPGWDGVVDLESGVAVANADIGSMAYLTNAKFRGKAKRTFVDAGSGERLWDSRSGDKPLNGYRAIVSNQVPSNLVKGTSGAVASACIFGNFADLIIGLWGSLDLQVNPYSLDTKGAVRIVAFQDVDIAVRHAESFSAIQDALTA